MTTVTNTVTTPVVKAPSKMTLARGIFQAKLVERAEGLFGSNKEFRSNVLATIEAQLGVSRASASTMFNTCKIEATTADATVGLGRDPKKVKAPSTGRRGRPVGSRNKPKVEVVAPVAETVEASA